MSVLGIDPGLRRTGLALVERGEIVAAHSVRRPRQLGRDHEESSAPEFAMALDAALDVAEKVWRWIEREAPAMEFVGEAFEDQAGRRHYSRRWSAPLVCGALVALAPRGVRITWQPAAVLSRAQYGTLYGAWKAGRRGLVPGDRGLADEHQAAAACHALHREAVLRAPERSA